jgi:hypothetical protein
MYKVSMIEMPFKTWVFRKETLDFDDQELGENNMEK